MQRRQYIIRAIYSCFMLFLYFSCVVAANWAVLVSTSNSWYDYRHSSNVLSIYQELLAQGMPSSRIILMMAGSFHCNPRNAYPGEQTTPDGDVAKSIPINYRGAEVTAANFMSLLTQRYHSDIPKMKRLGSTEDSNLFIYLTGHGGDNFLSFQDSTSDYLTSGMLDSALKEMWLARKYKNAIVMVDSCQASSLVDKLSSPNTVAVGSARRGESSYSAGRETAMGISLIDRFSWITTQIMRVKSEINIGGILGLYSDLRSHPQIYYPKEMESISLKDFFGTDDILLDDRILSTLD